MDESLKAQLQATLNLIPAYTWYAAPSGGLIFVNERGADYAGLPRIIRFGFGTDTSRSVGFAHPLSASGRSRRDAESLV